MRLGEKGGGGGVLKVMVSLYLQVEHSKKLKLICTFIIYCGA